MVGEVGQLMVESAKEGSQGKPKLISKGSIGVMPGQQSIYWFVQVATFCQPHLADEVIQHN